jgi:glycerol uptake facilitator protein
MSEISKRKEFCLEVVGTAILLAFGTGVVAMVVLFDGAKGDYTNITFGWGFAVLLGILASQPSGAHLNPAVTLALAVTKRFPWNKVWYYILAQMLGAFLGALITYLIFYGQFEAVKATHADHFAGIFSTFPAVEGYGYFDQIMGTAFLVFIILAIGAAVPSVGMLGPLFVGLTVIAIGMSFGGMHGYAINPARDLGPRLFSLIVGFKGTGFDNLAIWLLGPVVSPLIGGVLGALLFDLTRGSLKKSH